MTEGHTRIRRRYIWIQKSKFAMYMYSRNKIEPEDRTLLIFEMVK